MQGLQALFLQWHLGQAMTDGYFEFGELIKGLNPDSLLLPHSALTLRAVDRHPSFQLLELRRLSDSELLVVECTTGWSKSRIGIKYRERLALRFFSGAKRIPEVRALRKNFPDAPHQNHVLNGEPKSLCLYLETWPTIERTWTPEKHLNRILNWLTETANETLHRDDQPVEQVYFKGTFELVLPPDFDDKIGDKAFLLKATLRPLRDKHPRVMVSAFIPVAQVKKEDIPLACFALTLPPILHGGVEQMPNKLGELHDQLDLRGAPVGPELFKQIKERVGVEGIAKSNESHTLLVLRIPIMRQEGAEPERTEIRGFIISSGLGTLGVAGGALIEINQRFQRYTLMAEDETSQEWRNIFVEPIECLTPFTRKFARIASGLVSDGPNGVLAGVGALGSGIASIWHRQGWGKWSIIDTDHVKPHNLARHTAYEHQIGEYKVDAVNGLFRSLYDPTEICGSSIPEDACDFQNLSVAEALKSNELIVDATTTLEFPRDLSNHSDVKRAVTVFLTPSGQGSVMLMEDSARCICLDVLEAQYYRAILLKGWGANHLTGHYGHLRVGGGCRDVSSVMSTDLINVHSSTLARQIRLKSERPEAEIRVWHSDPETGELSTDAITPSPPIIAKCGSWQVIWNDAIHQIVRDRRHGALPNETGGVLLGYFDLKLMRIYLVDALPATLDSKGDKVGFTRGREGLVEAVEQAQRRTGNIVSYIGEWHSHPTGATANPSFADIGLLTYLAEGLQYDGLPAIMLIVGEDEEKFLLGQLL